MFSLTSKNFFLNCKYFSLNGKYFSLNGKKFPLNGKKFSLIGKKFSLDSKIFSLDGKIFSLNGIFFPSTVKSFLQSKMYFARINIGLVDFFSIFQAVCIHGNAVGLCRSNSNAAASLYPQLPTKKRFATDPKCWAWKETFFTLLQTYFTILTYYRVSTEL